MTSPSDPGNSKSDSTATLEPDLDSQLMENGTNSADHLDEIPDEVEMSLFDHLEELRRRIFFSLIAVVVSAIACFTVVNSIVQLLELPAQGVKFLQLAPGEYFFVSLQVAGYGGLLLASPFVLYQVVRFVLPGLTRRERRLLGPVFIGSTVLFIVGLFFAYGVLVPAALKFFITYGADVVEQRWSIEKYFNVVLLLMFSTGLAFQIPVIQILLGNLGIVSSQTMISGWRSVVLGAAVLGAILTPSTDPLTQSLLAGAVLGLYFSGIGVVKLMGK
ncbi:MAG: twin-arginine translocase subunit TatC [Microcoleaceae cyanobacterium]